MALICDGHSGTITFATSGTTLRWRTVGGQRQHRDMIDDTALGDTDELTCPGKLKRHDEFESEIIVGDDDLTKVRALLTAAREVITVTYPIAEGQSTAMKKEASGFVTSFTDPSLETGSNLIGTVGIKFSGVFTITDGVA